MYSSSSYTKEEYEEYSDSGSDHDSTDHGDEAAGPLQGDLLMEDVPPFLKDSGMERTSPMETSPTESVAALLMEIESTSSENRNSNMDVDSMSSENRNSNMDVDSTPSENRNSNMDVDSSPNRRPYTDLEDPPENETVTSGIYSQIQQRNMRTDRRQRLRRNTEHYRRNVQPARENLKFPRNRN
jgi:hypothetical protein